MKERNYLFDNIKALMLLLVAIGHILDVYIDDGNNTVFYIAMKYIYLFHMPVFAFVSGYFTKDFDRARNKAVKGVLIPYLILQMGYVIVAAIMIYLGLAKFNAGVFNYSIILPSSAFYYLLALFVWKLIAKDIMSLRCPLVISTVLGLLISFTKYDDFHMGYGAVFSLLIFYVLGIKCTESIINKIRKVPHVIAVFVLLLGLIPASVCPYSIHSIRLNYESEGFTNIEGMLCRCLFYIVAIVMGMAIINLLPATKTFCSKIGMRAILVYGGSTFLAPSGYVLICNLLHLDRNNMVNALGILIFSILILFVCSSDIINNIYQFIYNKIIGLLFKNTSQLEK